MNDINIVIKNDGEEIDEGFAKSWDIMDYCIQYNRKVTISFVGCIIKNNSVLFSFPKHYTINNKMTIDDIKSCMKSIMNLLSLKSINLGILEEGEKENFPFKAYYLILTYYNKFGIYRSLLEYTENGYSGKINWNKTINKSTKIIQNDDVIFLPFVVNNKKSIDVFLSECMIYILNDASKYHQLINLVIPFNMKVKNNIFNNKNAVINKLKHIKNYHFKDHEKELIQSFICYFMWSNSLNGSCKIITTIFENYWEKLVKLYLNHNFGGYVDNYILWNNDSKMLNLINPDMEYIESQNVTKKGLTSKFKIQYDHLYLDVSNKKVYLFDSKYYQNEINKFNYKQAFYYYHLKYQYKNYFIINGLVIPTSKAYYRKIHVDRQDRDGLLIVEHYINLKEVINFSLLNNQELIKEFNIG